MLKTINRYILWELLQTFVISLIVMTILLIIVGLIQKAMSESIPMTHVFRLVPFVMVEMAPISLPMTLLLAVTTFFARMSGSNEIIALKSLGIPPWMVLWPTLLLGFLISLFAVWVNEMAITWGRAGMRTVIIGASEDIILSKLRNDHHFTTDNGDVSIMVKGVENRRLISPIISIKKPRSATIEAKTAELKIDFFTQEFTISLSNVKLDSEDSQIISGDRTITIPLSQVFEKTTVESDRASDMGMNQIPGEIEENNDNIALNRRKIAAQRAFVGCFGAVDQWSTPELPQQKENIKVAERRISRLQAEPPRRWASGFCCLFFIWIGAPLAISMKKSDVFTSFFACFAPILLLYYPLLMYGMQGAKHGNLPPMAVWLANVCLAVIGLWFFKRIHRY